MEKRANQQKLANLRYFKLTSAQIKTIYSVFIDRYEHLNEVLRSTPTPQERERAAAEQAVVVTIITHICGPYVDPFLAEAVSESSLATGMPMALVPVVKGHDIQQRT